MIGLMGGVYLLAYYASQNGSIDTFEALMPADYRETLRALVVAGGHTCLRVCATQSPLRTDDTTTLDVSCSVSEATACTQTQSYRFTLAPTPLPTK
jgi:hypothetical protein